MLRTIIYNKLNKNYSDSIRPINEYILFTHEWLFNAYKISQKGIPAYYHLKKGWSEDYPETTGYIVSTLLNLYECNITIKRKIEISKLVNWLLSIQNIDGSFGYIGNLNDPMIFDTLQIVEGFFNYYKKENDKRIMDGIEKACFWVTSVPSGNPFTAEIGCLNKNVTYLIRAWNILLEVGKYFNKKKYIERATNEIISIYDYVRNNGFFKNCSVIVNEKDVLSHFLFYTVEGLLRGAITLNNEGMIELVKDFVIKINFNFKYLNNFLPLALNKELTVNYKSTCLTGLSQLAIINYLLYEKLNDNFFLKYGNNINDEVKKRIDLKSKNLSIRGGIQSCYPFTKEYLNYSYINWAAKFFLDALIVEKKYIQS